MAAVAEDWIQVFGNQMVDCQGDRRVASDVRRALRAAGYPALKRASVLIADGCVVLRGRAPSFHVKQVAQEIAMHVVHVREVINLIQVVDEPKLSNKERATAPRLEAR